MIGAGDMVDCTTFGCGAVYNLHLPSTRVDSTEFASADLTKSTSLDGSTTGDATYIGSATTSVETSISKSAFSTVVTLVSDGKSWHQVSRSNNAAEAAVFAEVQPTLDATLDATTP